MVITAPAAHAQNSSQYEIVHPVADALFFIERQNTKILELKQDQILSRRRPGCSSGEKFDIAA